MLRILFALLFATVLISCGISEYERESSFASEMGADAAPQPTETTSSDYASSVDSRDGDSQNQVRVPMVIHTGELAFTVDDIKGAKQDLDQLLQRIGGYYESDRFERNYSSVDNYLTIRFPSDQFDAVLRALESGMGQLERKNLNAKDVSEEYIDVNARLQNSLAYLEQYREILAKTKTVDEILAVREKIRAIQEDIEARKGRLKYLNSQVNMATLTVVLTKEVERDTLAEASFWSRLADAFGLGGTAALEVMIGLVAVWPLYLLVGVLLLGIRYYRRKQRRKTERQPLS